MALEFVKAGEEVKASTVNSLVDAALGQQTPSPDLEFTTTAQGPQLAMPYRFGGPNIPPGRFLQSGRYVLSAWPMQKLALGAKIEHCLETFRYHAADGTTTSPISAAVVFRNSYSCPFAGA